MATPVESGFLNTFYCSESREIKLILCNYHNKVLDISGMFAYSANRIMLETEEFKLKVFCSNFYSH